MSKKEFGRWTETNIFRQVKAIQKRQAREQRSFYRNIAAIMGSKMTFAGDGASDGKSGTTVDKTKLASDDLSEEQKKSMDDIMQNAMKRKQLERQNGKRTS